ncbi:hypothetical protein [Parageobacillus thermoglucosidasius]|uniref:hypothetical protein n=1 Tax=Parageobacillus thermoglucosidasius TaxID=1426 RepID=UPI000B56C43D|nr:hypothetical protein [Parageobacillus thermoglucosidasius]OUM85454.1 MAG: hypothetical protein BAA00_03445 [Parageobacillus thermoglucosidasius]
MSTFEYKRIKLTNLLVNTQNYRYEPVSSQIEAIHVMVREQKIKLYNLALDILKHGLNPSDLTVVSPWPKDNNLYIVHEGNRRVTTLKLLFEPDLFPPEFNNLQKKFKKLQTEYDLSPFEELMCVVFQNYDDADHWIEIKHTGEMEGAGTVRWDTAQQQRFKANKGGNISSVLQILELVSTSDYFDQDTKNNAQLIGVTNLQRLIGDPDVRSFLGISIKNSNVRLEKPEKEVAKGLTKIINDLASKRIIVNDIYYKADRLRYLETFQEHEIPKNLFGEADDKGENKTVSTVVQKKSYNTIPSPEKKVSADSEIDKSDMDKSKLEKTKSVSKPISTKRKYLIPSDFVVRPKDDRINNIYRELKQLEVDKFTNTTAVMLRVFLELSIDYFISTKQIAGVDASKKLYQKIMAAIDYLEKNEILTRKELQGVRYVLSSNTMGLTETLNAFVHSRYIHPSETELKTTWDNLALFIKTILTD